MGPMAGRPLRALRGPPGWEVGDACQRAAPAVAAHIRLVMKSRSTYQNISAIDANSSSDAAT